MLISSPQTWNEATEVLKEKKNVASVSLILYLKDTREKKKQNKQTKPIRKQR